MATYAIPAFPGWQAYTQPDGSIIEVKVAGDELYHYTINRAGQRVRLNAQGYYEVVGVAPTPAQVRACRAKAHARRQRQAVGVTPNLAPKGVVILANFQNSTMLAEHTRATFDELCNAEVCTVNNGYPSAAQYFADQSNGKYRPQFDVFGPVTLSKDVAYYGTDIPGPEAGDDQHAADALIEACHLADNAFTINWSDYDSDNDGYVDFVYVIYAGLGQAYGGTPETIWPHNWEISEARRLYIDGDEEGLNGTVHYCTYSEEDCMVGGKKIESYAMSGELAGPVLSGIGTLCHEFGHVIGLPDLYDTAYGDNETNSLTPGKWDIMDRGSYNGDGHCPPNYNPWEKAFFGWNTPVNPALESADLQLKATGKEDAGVYQLNNTGQLQLPTDTGWCYYLENRQQEGWDKFVPGHGLLIWKVNFDTLKWQGNMPNNAPDPPSFTIESASGSKIGTASNPFPGTDNVTVWRRMRSQSLENITETDGVITLSYVSKVEKPVVQWMVDGQLLEQRAYAANGTGDLALPTATFAPCEGTRFIGWTTHAEWCDPFALPEDLFTEPSGKVTKSVTYYAVFE